MKTDGKNEIRPIYDSNTQESLVKIKDMKYILQ